MGARTIVITGASDGIGAAAARQLAQRGERVVLVGRSASKTRALAAELDASYLLADFAELDQVRALAGKLAADHPRVDVLVNNAGAVLGTLTTTSDGFEKTFQVNYLAPFLLTHLLLPTLTASNAAVVNTSSSAAKNYGRLSADDLQTRQDYSPNRAYGNAKLENILFTKELHRRYHDRGINTVALDPGNIATNFASDTTSFFRFIYRTPLKHLVLASPEKGGDNLAFFAEGTPGTDWTPGAFYTKKEPGRTSPQAEDVDLATHLWDESAALLGV